MGYRSLCLAGKSRRVDLVLFAHSSFFLGTGKSRVIACLVLQLLYGSGNHDRKSRDGPRILLCAPSNAAVDVLVTRLLEERRQIRRKCSRLSIVSYVFLVIEEILCAIKNYVLS